MFVSSSSENPPLLLGMDDAAAALGITRRYLQTLIARGELPAVLLGRRKLVRRQDLETFVQSRLEPPAGGRVQTGGSGEPYGD